MKINTALSSKPFFVSLNNTEMSMDRIITEAVDTLKNTGKPLEGNQLEELYKTHQIFNGGKLVEKGDLFTALKTEEQLVGDYNVNVASIDLITSHAGGGKYKKKPVVVNAEQVFESGTVETLEGTMKYNYGDYLITGIKGEVYPCRKDIFEETYDEVKPDVSEQIKTQNLLREMDKIKLYPPKIKEGNDHHFKSYREKNQPFLMKNKKPKYFNKGKKKEV